MKAPLSNEIVVGIFVGGESSRMGSPKGLLPAPITDGTAAGARRNLLERLLYISEETLGLSTVLVGRRPEYEYLKRPTLVDSRPGCGPLGGLVALVEHAARQQKTHALALACDLPHLSGDLLHRLAFCPSVARVVCARRGARYEPVFARYHVSAAPTLTEALDQQRLSLQPLLATLQAEVLSLSTVEERQLVDWDSPSDLTR